MAPSARRAARTLRVPILPLSRRSRSRSVCCEGFVGHGHFRRGPVFPSDEGYYPHQLPGAHVRSHPRGSALEPEGECARVPGEVRWGHSARARRVNPGKNALFGGRHGVTPGHKSTSTFRPNQQKPSNNSFHRNSLQAIDLERFVEGFVGHLEGPFRRCSGTRLSAQHVRAYHVSAEPQDDFRPPPGASNFRPLRTPGAKIDGRAARCGDPAFGHRGSGNRRPATVATLPWAPRIQGRLLRCHGWCVSRTPHVIARAFVDAPATRRWPPTRQLFRETPRSRCAASIMSYVHKCRSSIR